MLELLQSKVGGLTAVVTTPDKPRGRGLRVQPNPVAALCQRSGLAVYAPPKLKDSDVESKVRNLGPEIFVVASYGKLIPDSWLRIPAKAALNLHPSLLPRYRGAAPIAWQILNGEAEAGVSVAELTKDLDAGDIFHQVRVPLTGRETSASLTERLAHLAAEALEEVLRMLLAGNLRRAVQDPAGASYARKLVKEDGYLNLLESSQALERQIRAFHPWPGAFVGFKGKPLKIVEAVCESGGVSQGGQGALLEIDAAGALKIQTGQGFLRITKVQLPGRRVILAREFANGARLKPGIEFTNLR